MRILAVTHESCPFTQKSSFLFINYHSLYYNEAEVCDERLPDSIQNGEKSQNHTKNIHSV